MSFIVCNRLAGKSGNSTASKLSISGVLAECSCENFQYSLATGQLLNPSEKLNPPRDLLFYQIQNFNGILRISN